MDILSLISAFFPSLPSSLHLLFVSFLLAPQLAIIYLLPDTYSRLLTLITILRDADNYGKGLMGSMWNKVAEPLSERFTVICADLRGTSSSLQP